MLFAGTYLLHQRADVSCLAVSASAGHDQYPGILQVVVIPSGRLEDIVGYRCTIVGDWGMYLNIIQDTDSLHYELYVTLYSEQNE